MGWAFERKYPRLRVAIPGELRCATEEFPRRALTTNLSVGGCYFEMMHTLQPKTRMQVILWLDGVKIRTWAEIVSHHPHVGNGVKFVHMAPADRERVTQFLDAMANKDPFQKVHCTSGWVEGRSNAAAR